MAARVLATEQDTDRGQAVYDVRVLARDGTVYVVHVSRASTAVLWADIAEAQTGTRGAALAEKPPHGQAERGGVQAEGGGTPTGPAGDR